MEVGVIGDEFGVGTSGYGLELFIGEIKDFLNFGFLDFHIGWVGAGAKDV